jgi:hypothetical protein
MELLGSTATAERPAKAREPDTDTANRAVPTAELVECNCPDVCDRDHETD